MQNTRTTTQRIEATTHANLLFPAGFAALIFAGIPAALLGLLWHPLSYSFYITGPAVFIFALISMSEHKPVTTRCPECRKRIKRGAARCHHCTALTADPVVPTGHLYTHR